MRFPVPEHYVCVHTCRLPHVGVGVCVCVSAIACVILYMFIVFCTRP